MAEDLPYDMGNSGDMLKHGFLAEFVRSWHSRSSDPLVFLDPFAGLPFCEPVEKVVSRLMTLKKLKDSALTAVQAETPKEYYGSSMLMRKAGEVFDLDIEVQVSDSDSSRLSLLTAAGFQRIEGEGFDPSDSFSILDTRITGDLLLIDPFKDFIPHRAESVIPNLASFSKRMTMVLFVLNWKPHNPHGQKYRKLVHQHCSGAWLAKCPPLRGTGVDGESKHHVELLIVPSTKLTEKMRLELFSRYKDYCQKLGSVIEANICFETVKGEAIVVGSYCRGCGRYFPAPKHPKDCCSCGPTGRYRRKFCEFCGKAVNSTNPTYCHHCKQLAGKP